MSQKEFFINKFLSKTKEELELILEDSNYVPEAKEAARYLLTNSSGQRKRQTTPRISSKYQYSSESPSHKRYQLNRILILGIACIVMAILLSTESVLVSKNNLIQVTGLLKDSGTHVQKVSSTSRYGRTSYSNRITLYFTLVEQPYIFKLNKNIGIERIDEDYETLNRVIRHAEEISVWIRKDELESLEPKIFRLATEKTTLITFDSVKHEFSNMIMFLFLVGLLSVGFYIHKSRPQFFKNLFSKL